MHHINQGQGGAGHIYQYSVELDVYLWSKVGHISVVGGVHMLGIYIFIYPLWEGFIGHLLKGGHISVVCGRLGIYQLWEGFICWA